MRTTITKGVKKVSRLTQRRQNNHHTISRVIKKKSHNIHSGSKKAHQAVFFSNQLCNKNNLSHYIRIPEVMTTMNKARYILKNKGFALPVWLWGLVEKGDKWDSTYESVLMSFLINVALYDRLIRLSSIRPQFLIGSSLALDVCAKFRTFESSLVDIMCHREIEQNTVRVYKRKPYDSPYFLLQYFSHTGAGALKDLKKHRITRCVSVLPISAVDKKRLSASSLKAESMIERDSLLSWLWEILSKNSIRKSNVCYH